MHCATGWSRAVAAHGRGAVRRCGAERLANTSYFAFPGIDGETLVMALDRAGFAVASGSACSSGSTDPSPVLLAMGVERELARCAVRVSLGRDNEMSQVERFLRALQGEILQVEKAGGDCGYDRAANRNM